MAVVSEAQLNQFDEDGFLVVENALDTELDLKPVVNEYSELLDSLCSNWYAEGKLPSPYPDLPFAEKLIKVLNEGDQAYDRYIDITLPGKNVTEDTPIHLGKAVFNLLRSPRLLDVVECFVGPEIYSSPVQHVRIKPPERHVPDEYLERNSIGRTNWHQDQGVVLSEADDTNMLTVWFPVFDTDAENGCLMVVPQSRRHGLVEPCTDPEKKQPAAIPDRFIRNPQPVPLKAGSVLFFHRTTMHASCPNVSDRIRWSFDIRYQPIGQPTGRPFLPGFIARSRKDPASELTDPEIWADLWRKARSKWAGKEMPPGTRWATGFPVCS